MKPINLAPRIHLRPGHGRARAGSSGGREEQGTESRRGHQGLCEREDLPGNMGEVDGSDFFSFFLVFFYFLLGFYGTCMYNTVAYLQTLLKQSLVSSRVLFVFPFFNDKSFLTGTAPRLGPCQAN